MWQLIGKDGAGKRCALPTREGLAAAYKSGFPIPMFLAHGRMGDMSDITGADLSEPVMSCVYMGSVGFLVSQGYSEAPPADLAEYLQAVGIAMTPIEPPASLYDLFRPMLETDWAFRGRHVRETLSLLKVAGSRVITMDERLNIVRWNDGMWLKISTPVKDPPGAESYPAVRCGSIELEAGAWLRCMYHGIEPPTIDTGRGIRSVGMLARKSFVDASRCFTGRHVMDGNRLDMCEMEASVFPEYWSGYDLAACGNEDRVPEKALFLPQNSDRLVPLFTELRRSDMLSNGFTRESVSLDSQGNRVAERIGFSGIPRCLFPVCALSGIDPSGWVTFMHYVMGVRRREHARRFAAKQGGLRRERHRGLQWPDAEQRRMRRPVPSKLEFDSDDNDVDV